MMKLNKYIFEFLSAIVLLPGWLCATTFVKPGDTGSILLPVKNILGSVGDMENVEIEVAYPTYFTANGTPLIGPQTISANGAYSFEIPYKISSDAQDNNYKIALKVKTTTDNCVPKPAGTWSANVDLIIDRTSPKIIVVDSRGVVISDGGASNGRNLRITVDDTRAPDGTAALGVSGPGKIEIYAGDPIPANLIQTMGTDYVGQHTYTLAELGQPPEGVITVRAYDQVGNFTTMTLTIDRRAPVVYLPVSKHIVHGIQTEVFKLTEHEDYQITDDPASLCAGVPEGCKSVSGIKSFKVFSYPAGLDVVGPYIFAPPVIEQGGALNLPIGDYVLAALDDVGNETSLRLKVSGFSLEVSTADSHITIDRDSNSFAGTIHVTARSSAGLKRLVLLNSLMTSIDDQPLSGESMVSWNLKVNGNLDDYYFRTNHFAAGFSDMDGRIVWEPLNLIFSDAKNFSHSFGDLQTENFTTPVLDLTQATPVMLLNGIVSIYAPTREERVSMPRWKFEGGNGFYSYTTGDSQGWRAASVPVDKTKREDIGRITTVMRTWDNPDKSDMLPPTVVANRELFLVDADKYVRQPGEVLTCGNQLGYEGELSNPGIGQHFCYKEHAETNQTFPLKRFVESEITVEPASPASVLNCHTIEEAPPGEPPTGRCATIYDFLPAYAAAGPAVYGIGVNMETVHSAIGSAIEAGHNVIRELSGGIMVNFGANTVFTPGMLRSSYESVENYPGFRNLSGNLAINLETEATFDHARLTIPYNAEGLTLSQESAIKVYRITPDGEYIALGTTVDAVNKKVQSAEMDSFSRFMVAAPRYTDPRTVASQANAVDKPQLEFTAEGVLVEQSVFNTNTPEGAALLASIAEKGVLASNVYQLGPGELSLETPGTLKMHYDASAAEAAGIKSVAIYRANADGTGFFKLPGAISDPAGREVAAEVWQPAGLYMLIGNTAGVAPDRTPPVVTISYGEPKFAQADKVYLSTRTQVSIAGVDTGPDGSLISGMGPVYYLVDASPALGTPVPYSGPLTLSEGVRTLYYSGVDQAGNKSVPSSRVVYVDGTPPSAELSAGGEKYLGGASWRIPEGSLITISSVDLEVSGVASGVKAVYRLVDVSPAECESAAPPAACATAEYAAPFSLPAGTHRVYYGAVDNVGNVAAVKSVTVNVESAVSVKFYPAVKSVFSILWQWDLVEGATGYQLFSSTGGALSGLLQYSATSYSQIDLIPNTAYSNRLVAYTPNGSYDSGFSVAVTLANVPLSAESFVSGQNASVVIGQPDFYSRNNGNGSGRLSQQEGVAIDGDGNLWVADQNNHRVLRFHPPFTTGMSADLVLGQPSFYLNLDPFSPLPDVLKYPSSLAFDSAGNLWVSDYGFHRILRFPKPFTSGMYADLVIGAADPYSGPYYAEGRYLCSNWGLSVTFDASDNLWVADSQCNRVLRFPPPFANGMGADRVLGQNNFSPTYSGALGPDKLRFPMGLSSDAAGNLWVADSGNNRVLRFMPPFENGKAASLVIGQPDLASGTAGYPDPSKNNLRWPNAVNLAGNGDLWIDDSSNSRILKYSPPFANNMDADVVVGQPDFTSRVSATTPAGLRGMVWDFKVTGFIATDPSGRMWVSDGGNNRVLLFKPGLNRTFTAIGTSSFTVKWDTAFNPAATLYQAEISDVSDFSSGLMTSGFISSAEYTFTGLQTGKLYYARVKAKNVDGLETDYNYPGSIPTSPAAATGFAGIGRSSVSIEWGWLPPSQYAGYQVFSSTGGAVSGLLAQGASWYLQTELTPNTTYTYYVRAINEGGFSDSSPALAGTHAAVPEMPAVFVNGQDADIVLGQDNFNSAICKRTRNGLCYATDSATDENGNLWVADNTNCRVLKFEPPFVTGKDAALVIGQSDFTSGYCGNGRDKLNSPSNIAFDSEGRLWVSDRWNRRVLMFNQPFSTGMGADLVIGQSGFDSSLIGDSLSNLGSPSKIVFDPDGNLWVTDPNNNRVLRFRPPFSDGMSANLSVAHSAEDLAFDPGGNMWVAQSGANKVLKFVQPFSTGMTASLAMGSDEWPGYITPNHLSRPSGVAFDGRGNLYVANYAANRVSLFKPPFPGTGASAVLGQADSSYYDDPGTSVNRLAYPEDVSIGKDMRIWVADTDNKRVVGYGMSPFTAVSSSSFVVKWRDTVNPAGTQYQAEVAGEISFSTILLRSPWLNSSSFTFIGLSPKTGYYVRLKARNLSQVEAVPLYLGSVETLAAPRSYSRSGTLVNGSPEVSIKSPLQMSISLAGEGSEAVRIAIASATAQSLVPVGNIYEVGPEGEYDPPAFLTFRYSTSSVTALDVQESELAVYEYFAGTGWVKLAGQTLDTINKKITVPINRVASLFGIFIESIDFVAPVTKLTLKDAENRLFQSGAAEIYINSKSSITLTAHDPVFRGMASGVAFTEYRVDPDTSTPFTVYSLPFTLSTGFHTLEYRSRDNAGNLEVVKSTAVYMDSVEPATELLITGTTGQNGWHVSTGTIVLISTDSYSGVSSVYYKVLRDGDLPPAATDYLLYSSPIEFNGEGEYFLYYYAEDNTGNIEVHKSTAFKLDLTTPTATYTSFPAPNPDSWNNVPVSVTFTGTDAVSGIAYCSSSFTLSGEGLRTPVSGYCADYAGWTSTVSFIVNIDTTGPSSNAEIAAEQGLNGWLLSPFGITLTSTDSLSGTAGLYYAVDGSSFALYFSSFSVNGEGAHSLTYYSVDRAGNKEVERELAFKLDLNSPIVSAVPGPTANPYGWNNTAVSVIFSGTDTISGLAYCEPKKIVETEGSSRTITGYCSDYAGRSSTVSLTVSVDTTAPNLSYTAEPLANQLGWNNSDVALKFACSDSLSGVKFCPADILLRGEGVNISTSGAVYDYAGNSGDVLVSGIKIDRTAPIGTAAVSGVYENGWYSSPVTLVLASTDSLSGLKGIVYSLDGGGYSEYTQPVVVSSEGNHVLSYYSEDLAGNIESARTIDFSIDATAPMADYLLSPPANPVGWNSSGVNVLFRGSDTLSGVVVCSTATVAGEGKGQEIIGWCRDLAGNIAYATATLNIDMTRPLVSADQAPARNAFGWNNGPVDINLTGADALSGIAYCEPVKTISIAGASQTVAGYCMDYAGLSSTATYIISIDTAAPLLAYSRTPANNYGWNNSDVTINFDCLDDLSGIAGCPGPVTYPAEGINISTSVRAWDLAGNYKDSTVSDINIDRTMPVSTAAVSGIYRNGWYSSTVEIVLGSTDALSGVKGIYYSLDGGDYVGYQQSLNVNGDGSHEIKYYAVDKAGNIETVGKAVFKIDRQAPAIGHILNPEFNAAGWNNSAVSVVFTGTDAVSGVEECSSGNIALEGAGQEIAGWCRDLAGNISYATATVNIDLTMPLASVLQTPERNAYGWNNTPVTAVFTGTDAVSGIAYCSSNAVLETEGSSRTLAGYCEDHAGWSSTASLTVNIDTTAPGLAYIANPAANEADWNNSSVVLEFTCADSLSGVRTCPAVISLSGEGIDISTSVAAYDYAGNLKDILVRGINIDKTMPVSTATLSGTYRNGWYSSVVSAVLSSTDTLSGVKRIIYRLESKGGTSEEKVYTDPLELKSDGTYKLYYAAEDAAGNREVEKAIEFNIDATAPLVKHALLPVPNSKDWNNTTVQVVFSGTDTVSGIELCSSETVGVEGSLQKIAGWCRDLAGNIGYSTATVNIDKTSPVISISSPAAGQIFVATRGRIYIGFGVQDNLDPASGLVAYLVQTEDSGSPRGLRPAVIAVTNGQSIEPLDIDDGIWRLAVSATDFADNTSTLSGGTFEVVHDVLAPRTGQTRTGGASFTDGVATYITYETVLKFSSADDLVLAEDGIGLGVKKQTIKLKTAGSIVKELAFENPEPKQGTVFNSTFTLAATLGLADGLYSLAYYAEDILGNIEGEKTLLIGLDNAAPLTAAELTGAPGEDGWHISAVSVKLIASDAISEVAGIYYQSEFNGQKSELRSYTGPFSASAEGLYNVYFYAKDRLGNTEAEKTIAFKIDHTDPLISAERTPLANAHGWNNTTVTVNYLCTDGLSGVRFCPPAAVLAGEGINQNASGEAKDNAGNSSTASISGINIDKTAPVSTYRIEGTIYKAGDGKNYLSPTSKLSLSATDPVSGSAASNIDAVEYYIDSTPFIVYTSSFSLSEGIRSVYYRSRDKAGNEETGKSVELHIDGTSPATSFNISGTPYIVDGTHYINSQSVISFAVADPLTEGVASGVLITKYRLDDGAWQVYAASITIPVEGLHKLEYYSLDNVQNTEAVRTLTIIVDNTAPAATLSVGEPVFEVFGLKIMTPETPVTLAATDPEASGPASGVRSIYYELTDAAGQGSGVRNYTEPFNTSREGVFTVNYWSVDNAGNSGTPLEAKLRVSSLRSDALDAIDGLEMTGSADIAGTVRSNATVSLAGNARILGDVYASTISISGKAQLTGQQHSGAATLVPTPLYMPEIVEIASNTNNNSLVPAKYLVNGRLVVPAKDELTLSTGVYYFNGIDLGGGAKVGVNGKVDILVAGNISINGGASMNATGSSSRLNIFLSTGSALTFNGGGSLAAYVYAPYSQLKLAGNALLGGHYFVKRAIIIGAGNILQAGEALPAAAAPPGGGPKTKAAAMPSGGYSVLAGPDPAFRLGEVYVFPNPAKGGEAPVFHVETGIADSVKITIYTISGRAAHEQTLIGVPTELDDGNGLSYAYEYVWRGHIPSGVYLYYIETQKAGQKLKKTGKFSVVR